MHLNYNVIVYKEENWYVSKCIDNNVASQGKTIEEALSNLKEALELFNEDTEPIVPKQLMVTTLEVVI